MTNRLKLLAAGGIALVAVLAIVTIAVLRGDDGGDPEPRTAPGSTVASSAPASNATTSVVPVSGPVFDVAQTSTLIAGLRGDTPAYEQPGGEQTGVLEPMWHDRPKALPVVEQRPGWFKVRLPERPNGSTAWIRNSDVDVTSTPYRIVIDVATMRLQLLQEGEVVMDAPAGIGTDDAPTTVGEFFLTFLQEPPDTTSGWGPFVVVTSAHSETISDFQQSGDAIAAIHGPLGAADEIGTTGAKVSHGCVRLHLEHLEQLRNVPAGTPIDIIDSSTSGGGQP